MEPQDNSCSNRRILQLLRAGYTINLSDSLTDIVGLRHISRKMSFGDKNLYVMPDGTVRTAHADNEGYPVDIGVDDDSAFRHLLGNVHTPTWWELNQAKLIDRVVQIAFFITLISLSLLAFNWRNK